MAVKIEKLTGFIAAYWRAMESGLDGLGRDLLPYHGEPCNFVLTYLASDGVAVFYMPGQPANAPPGAYVYDYSRYSLNQVMQSLHLGTLQFRVPEVGSTFTPLVGPIERTEPIPDLNTYYFSEAARDALLTGERHTTGVTVTPVFHVSEGIVTKVYPSRVKLWSPVVEYDRTGRIRYFFWNHADIWWDFQSLTLPDPEQLARSDLTAIQVVQATAGAFSLEQTGPDTSITAAEKLEDDIREFLDMLARGPGEEVIHAWFVDHRYFLDAQARRIHSKLPFGPHVSDFVVERTDRTYELVEIEGVQRIFTPSRSEPCARFNHACGQVRDWIRYINENLRTVQLEHNLEGIYQPDGRVIMGRSQDIDTERARLRWMHLKSEPLSVDTYDDLVARVSQLANTLRSVLHQ